MPNLHHRQQDRSKNNNHTRYNENNNRDLLMKERPKSASHAISHHTQSSTTNERPQSAQKAGRTSRRNAPKNFVAENKRTLGFQSSHPMGYDKSTSNGLWTKINPKIFRTTSVRDRAFDPYVDELNSADQSYRSRSRPSSASSIQRVTYKPTGRHSEIIEYCQKALPTPAWMSAPSSPHHPPGNERTRRATPEPSFDRRKTKEIAKENIAGFIPNNGAKIFEQSSIPREMKESYLPKKRGVQFPAPGPHAVVMAVHSSRHRIMEPNLARAKIPVHPDDHH